MMPTDPILCFKTNLVQNVTLQARFQTPLLCKLHWLPLSFWIQFKIITTYQLLQGIGSGYLPLSHGIIPSILIKQGWCALGHFNKIMLSVGTTEGFLLWIRGSQWHSKMPKRSCFRMVGDPSILSVGMVSQSCHQYLLFTFSFIIIVFCFLLVLLYTIQSWLEPSVNC